jgi:hypothetical protein
MPVAEGKWKDACAAIGELALLYTALDHQLYRIIIEVMHLEISPMLESVVATLDARQKIEMLKTRAGHVEKPDVKKALKAHADRLERVSRMRNAACHTPLVPKGDSGFEFAPAAASKLLKSMTVRSRDDYTVERLTLERVLEVIPLAIGHLSYRFSVANFGATMATAPAAGVVVSVSRNAPIVLRPCRRAIAAIGPGVRRSDGAWRQQGILRLQSQVAAISFGGPVLKAASGPRPRR